MTEKTTQRNAVLAACRTAKARIPRAENGFPSTVFGEASLGEDRILRAYWVFHRGNPGAWKIWYDITDLAGRTLFSNTSSHSLARVVSEAATR